MFFLDELLVTRDDSAIALHSQQLEALQSHQRGSCMFIPKDVEVDGGFSHKLFESPFSVARWLAQSLCLNHFVYCVFPQLLLPELYICPKMEVNYII